MNGLAFGKVRYDPTLIAKIEKEKIEIRAALSFAFFLPPKVFVAFVKLN